jgi:hypothetical protein
MFRTYAHSTLACGSIYCVGLTHVGSFFALQGEKRTYKG